MTRGNKKPLPHSQALSRNFRSEVQVLFGAEPGGAPVPFGGKGWTNDSGRGCKRGRRGLGEVDGWDVVMVFGGVDHV